MRCINGHNLVSIQSALAGLLANCGHWNYGTCVQDLKEYPYRLSLPKFRQKSHMVSITRFIGPSIDVMGFLVSTAMRGAAGADSFVAVAQNCMVEFMLGINSLELIRRWASVYRPP